MTETARSISVGVPGSVRGDDAYTFTQKINGNKGIRAAQPGTGRYNVMAWVTGDGTTDDYANLVLAQTAAVAAGAPLYFPVGCLVRLGTSWTVGSGTALLFERGAKLLPDAGKVVTIAGDVIAGPAQIFGGSGTIALTKESLPEWFGAVCDGATDDSTALNTAIQSVDTTGGGGGVVTLRDGGVYDCGTTTIVFKQLVEVRGGGHRASILNYHGAGALIDVTDINTTGLSGCRLAPGTNAAAIALRIRATTASVLYSRFRDIDIVGSNTAGQIGISLVTTAPQIITGNVFDSILIQYMDKPIKGGDPEGNFWENITIDTFGTGASPVAIDMLSHDDVMTARVAGVGAGVTTPIAYKQAGNWNVATIMADIGATGTALNVTGGHNDVTVSRPAGVTAVGSYTVTTTVREATYSQFPRFGANGTTLVAGDFSLGAGFGAGATVTAITGTDQRCRFAVNPSGAGIAANATVTLFFHDGAWPATPFFAINRTGGNQLTVPTTWGASTIGVTITFNGTPVAGESYSYEMLVIG